MKVRPVFADLLILLLASIVPLSAAEPPAKTTRGDQMLADYFRVQTAKLAEPCLTDIKTLEAWQAGRDKYRAQLFEMLSLSPLPKRTDLKAEVTGKFDHDGFTVEKLHFQSMPGLYVTANLYVPKNLSQPAPTVLYVCGHGEVKKNSVSFGNKVTYHHHGVWLARNGYVCLIIDTLQLGEIQGLHHGTYREGMWWWNARGYTPAGVEAWNSIRALDYLESRPEVDRTRIGMTGRSGGGAYSWTTAALDERVKVVAPVAGITDLQNHVVEGTVEGHCDCMFFVNTYRWDYAQMAALVAPRPLLICNTDSDSIFPLDGVVRLHSKVRNIYALHKATDKLGLVITPGPHKDTQELQLPVLRWFNHFLKNDDAPVESAAAKKFQPEQLKVFESLPDDQVNTKIQEAFVPRAEPPSFPQSSPAWAKQRDNWLASLKEKSFAGWPEASEPLELKPAFAVEKNGVSLRAFDFTSQSQVGLRLFLVSRTGLRKPDLLQLKVLNADDWQHWTAILRPAFAKELSADGDGAAKFPDNETGFKELAGTLKSNHQVWAYVAPRGIGPTAWTQDQKRQVQIRRRFMLLGQTLDGMRVWDCRRAIQALRTLKGFQKIPLWLEGKCQMAGIALYASLFEPGIDRLDLWQLPKSHREGPDFLNVLRILDVPQAVAIAAERGLVNLHQQDTDGWDFPARVQASLGWSEKKFVVELSPLAYSR